MTSVTIMEARTLKEDIEMEIIEYINSKVDVLMQKTGLHVKDIDLSMNRIDATMIGDRRKTLRTYVTDFKLKTDVLD